MFAELRQGLLFADLSEEDLEQLNQIKGSAGRTTPKEKLRPTPGSLNERRILVGRTIASSKLDNGAG